MHPSFAQELAPPQDLAHRLRRLRFFDEHFHSHIEALAQGLGMMITIDRVRLTRAFLAWGEDFTRQRTAAVIDRRDYTVFTAGMLLTRLIEMQPVVVLPPTAPAEPSAEPNKIRAIIAFWPEGFLYTDYCMKVLQVVVEQETKQVMPISAVAQDLRNWWSFRENVREDRWSAVGFFDLFVGAEPNWLSPTIATQRPAMRRKPAKTPVLP